jgi:hypothetical protein
MEPKMLRLLWPTRTNPSPTLLGRLGRVLHWSLAVFAVLIGLLSARYFQTASAIDVTAPASGGWESAQQIADWHSEQGAQWLFFALGLFIAARAARYVLSAE